MPRQIILYKYNRETVPVQLFHFQHSCAGGGEEQCRWGGRLISSACSNTCCTRRCTNCFVSIEEDCTKHNSNGGIIHIFFVVVSQVCSCIFVCICKSRVRGWQRVRKGERRPVNWSCKSFLSTLLLTISLSHSPTTPS